MKVFDCSLIYYNDPKMENDIMVDLKKYSHLFNIEYVDDYKKSDVIITNKIYSDEILEWSEKYNIPKVKRMDGIFWSEKQKRRNLSLNDAAIKSDKVIFISQYSKDALTTLYPEVKLKESTIILNNSDESIFKPTKNNNRDFWFCSATDWSREEKRLEEIILFAKNINEEILMIGKCDKKLPKNIHKFGFIIDYKKMVNIINSSFACVNMSYRDAAPKIVSQSLACGKPVLYADSGGVKEMVREYGVGIKDNKEIKFDSIYRLKEEDLISGYFVFMGKEFSQAENKKPYLETIKDYFDVIKSF